MSESGAERLYALLPAVYRLRDADEGYPLRALMAVMETEMAAVEADISGLYENWFIETCQEWVVPYVGDLLGVRGLRPAAGGAYTQRARVANAIGYRRRKGTAAVLEQVARDVTGWPAHAVEYFQLLAGTQHLSHVRPGTGGTASLRDSSSLELVGGPFEQVAHTAEVRHIDNGRGRYNIPDVGVFLWRLQSYPVVRAQARLVTAPGDAGYTFSPLGTDGPLFNRARTETAISHLAREQDVPDPLRRRALYDELEARRASLEAGAEVVETWFGDDAVIQVFLDGELVPGEQVMVCDLDPWRRPPASTFQLPDGRTFDTLVSVDPPRGRLALADGLALPDTVEVGFAYGFPGDLGGGPYDRREPVEAWLERVGGEVHWQAGVVADPSSDPDVLYADLRDAVAAWNAQPPGTVGVIAVMDSRTLDYPLTGGDTVLIPEGSHLLLVAAGWPDPAPMPPGGGKTRLLPQDLRPHLRGSIAVRGVKPQGVITIESSNPGSFSVDGLLIEGEIEVRDGNLGQLLVSHSTLVPAAGGVTCAAGNPRLEVTIARSITGAVSIRGAARLLRVEDSIVDGLGALTALRGPAVELEAVTLFGGVRAVTLTASNSIFTRTVTVERRQTGCVRYSWVPPQSRVPRRYECRPETASAARREEPQFTSRGYGHPAYAQLSLSCPAVIREGADDEGEMGAWHFLQQTQRIADLRAGLGEHLRVGLEAGLFFAT
ncbi:phage tail protein [Longimicrobium sp.]|uniref:phage tail protein n=1 Tax=Longimicrobium sp. TaxID=2029185 RepID=UPI002BD7F8B5|nr:phage tail protein [Longimicrobium sp.]HSU13666.1 phage tail protein [Longimicrobium sp.]